MTHTTGNLPDFSALVRDYSGPLLRYLERQIGDVTVAEDLLQETLLRAARGLPTFAGRASLKTWLYSIAGNVVVDHLRLPIRQQKIVAIDEAADIDDGSMALEQRVIVDEMNACVREVIDSLPPDYRSALILHDIEGMDGAQTAEVLGISLGATKVRLHRARARLKEALQKSCGFYRDEESVFRCERRN